MSPTKYWLKERKKILLSSFYWKDNNIHIFFVDARNQLPPIVSSMDAVYNKSRFYQPEISKRVYMPEYHSLYQKGGTYFFVVVTYLRQPFLTQPVARELLHESISFVQKRHPFRVDAICLLPDHLHCIWTMLEEDTDFSVRWREIKRRFTHKFWPTMNYELARNESREQRSERTIWQRRFWEHLIRNEKDYETHLNYIHYNPVKHGLVSKPADWEWSSFHRYVKEGAYPQDWSDQGKDFQIKIDKEYE